jgi:hypothetical protein
MYILTYVCMYYAIIHVHAFTYITFIHTSLGYDIYRIWVGMYVCMYRKYLYTVLSFYRVNFHVCLYVCMNDQITLTTIVAAGLIRRL